MEFKGKKQIPHLLLLLHGRLKKVLHQVQHQQPLNREKHAQEHRLSHSYTEHTNKICGDTIVDSCKDYSNVTVAEIVGLSQADGKIYNCCSGVVSNTLYIKIAMQVQ